jgi:flavin-dependent dehydrogenase
VSALTGGGMYPAMVSGVDIARKILDPEYGCENIERYLKIKNLQEFFVKIMETNRILAKLEYWALLKMANSGWGAQRLLNRFE